MRISIIAGWRRRAGVQVPGIKKVGAPLPRRTSSSCGINNPQREEAPIERYIGLDVRAASCTLDVISQTGRRMKDWTVETNGQALVEAVRMMPVHGSPEKLSHP